MSTIFNPVHNSGILGSNNGFFPAHTVNTASPPTSAARMYGAESVRARVLYDCGKDTDIRPLSGTDGSVCGGEGGDNNDQKGNYNDNKNSNDDLNYSNDSHCDTELHDCDMQNLNTEINIEKSKTKREVCSIEDRQRIFKKSKKKSKIVAMTSCLWSLAFLVKFE